MWVCSSTCFAQPAYCLGMSENPAPALVNCFPEQCDYFSMVCLQRTFCTFSYKINSRRLPILQGACSSSWGGVLQRKEKLSHSESLENCKSGFSTYLLYFRYLSIPHFAPFNSPFLTLVFVIYLSSTEHRSLELIQFGLDRFSMFLLLCVPSARRDSRS